MEDDLSDCGIMEALVQLVRENIIPCLVDSFCTCLQRVMEKFWYLSGGQTNDARNTVPQSQVRIYHEFGTDYLLRDVSITEREHKIHQILCKQSDMLKQPASGHSEGRLMKEIHSIEKFAFGAADLK